MTAYANAESYSDTLIHSRGLSSRDAGHEPNDSDPDGDTRTESELKTAVSAATAQLGRDLRLVGSQLLSIETGHRAFMERLQQIAAQVDERTLRQFEALQREHEAGRQQISTVREELAALRGSFPEQLKIIRNQCQTFRREFQVAEQRFKEIDEELRSAEDRIKKTTTEQHNAVEQRLLTLEPKTVAAEHNLRRTEEWRHSAEQRFTSLEQQLHISEQRIRAADDQHNIVEQRLQVAAQKAVQLEQDCRRTDERMQTTERRCKDTDEHLQGVMQQLQEVQQQLQGVQRQLADAVGHIKTFEPQIRTCEEQLQHNTGLLVETKKTLDEQVKRRENVEISIGALAQQSEQLKTELSKVSDARLKNLLAMLKSNKRMQALAMLAWIMSLLLVGYIGIGNRGWSIVTQYLSQWVPGSLI